MLELFFMLSNPVVLAGIILVLIVLLIFVGIYLRGKTVVTVPSMTLTIDKNQYDHGETVAVTGIVKSDVDVPAAGETVTLTLKDSTDTGFAVGTAVTDAEGKYAASFSVPNDVAPGGVTVIAECANLGVTATQTFTLLR